MACCKCAVTAFPEALEIRPQLFAHKNTKAFYRMISWLKKLLGSGDSAPHPATPPGPFAEAEARAARVREQLLAAPLVELLGVVAPSGCSGSKGGPGTPWHIGCELVAWRVADGPLQENGLTLTRQVEEKQIRDLQDSLPAYAVRKLRARLLRQSEMGPRAWLEKVVGPARDAELEAIAAKLQEAVTHEDEVFGTCTLDRALDWYSGRGRWMGTEVDVHLSTAQSESLPALLALAHGVWAAQESWHQRQ